MIVLFILLIPLCQGVCQTEELNSILCLLCTQHDQYIFLIRQTFPLDVEYSHVLGCM